MGYRYSLLHEGEILIEIGSYDWENHLVKVWDANARCILLTAEQARQLLSLLPKAISDCEQANRE